MTAPLSPTDPNAFASLHVPGTPKRLTVVIPRVTVASLAVYTVMGGLGYALSRFGHKGTASIGKGLGIAAFVGAGYAVSHAIVQNLAPEAMATAAPKEPEQ